MALFSRTIGIRLEVIVRFDVRWTFLRTCLVAKVVVYLERMVDSMTIEDINVDN